MYHMWSLIDLMSAMSTCGSYARDVNTRGDVKAWCATVALKVAANMTINRQAGAKARGFSTLNPVLSPTSTEGSDTTWGMLVRSGAAEHQLALVLGR